MNWSPTVDGEGNFRYSEGELWEPYVWRKGEAMNLSGGVYDTDAPDHSRMVAELLMNEVLFVNSRPYVSNPWDEEDNYSIKGPTLVLFVICNDIFAWACASAECVSMEELPSLYEEWRADRTWGAAVWCIKKRKQMPQPPVLRELKASGAWTEEIEKLIGKAPAADVG